MVITGNFRLHCRAVLVICAALCVCACGRGEQPAVQSTAKAAPASPPPQAAPPARPVVVMPRPPELKALPIVLEQGAAVYGERCGNCHGLDGISGGTIPDLRFMNADTHLGFLDIVLGGSHSDNGMPGFAEVMTESDANAVHAYIISRARETYTGD